MGEHRALVCCPVNTSTLGPILGWSCVIATCTWFASGAAIAASPAWKPDKVVEIVVNTAPGNSPDKTARSIQRILQEHGLAPTAITVSNRVGGGGAVAYTYLNQRPGDGHYIAIASKALLTNHIMGRGPNPGEFTPVAHWGSDFIGSAGTRKLFDSDYAQIKALLVDLELAK